MKRILMIIVSVTSIMGWSEYFMGPGDRISIHVLSTTERGTDADPMISGNFMIDPSGNISMHLIGTVHCTGMTPELLRTSLQERLSEYVKHPDVTVNVDTVQNSRVLVLGEVRFPGVYSLYRDTTALDALALAGGHTISCLLWNVKIVRGNLNNPTVININLERAMKQGDLSQNILLQSGDIVYFPKTFVWRFNELLGQINPAMNTLITGTDAASRLR